MSKEWEDKSVGKDMYEFGEWYKKGCIMGRLYHQESLKDEIEFIKNRKCPSKDCIKILDDLLKSLEPL